MRTNQPIMSFERLGATRRVRLKDRRLHPHARAHWPGVVGVDAMSRDELLGLQESRLDDLVRHAVTHVPFYRRWASDSGYQPGDRVRLDTLPILAKSDYNDPDDFQSDAYPLSSMTSNKTSGSTGDPFRFRQHAFATDYSYCVLWRALHRFGLRPGHKRAFVWGRAYSFRTSGRARLTANLKIAARDWFNNTLSIEAFSLAPSNVVAAVRRIDAYRPVYVHGYVSALHTIARCILDENQPLTEPPRLVITESEALHPFQRKAIEQAFRCPVIANYGSVELGKIAQPDPDGHTRINEDMFIVERLPSGEAAITNLFSHAFPFIRYRLGDLIELDDDIPSGLPYACLKSVVGRVTDIIPVASGARVHGVALAIHVIYPHLDHIAKYQIRQTALDRFTVTLVTRGPLPGHVPTQISRNLRDLAGQDAHVEIVTVDHIEPGPTGKFRWVLSDLTGPPPETGS